METINYSQEIEMAFLLARVGRRVVAMLQGNLEIRSRRCQTSGRMTLIMRTERYLG